MFTVIRRAQKRIIVEAYGPFNERREADAFIKDHREMMEAWDNVEFQETYTILEMCPPSVALESAGI